MSKRAVKNYLDAAFGSYRPKKEDKDDDLTIRITKHQCVMDEDIKLLPRGLMVERDVVACGELKRKQFTRLRLRNRKYLACRVTGTLYDELTGETSSPQLRLA